MVAAGLRVGVRQVEKWRRSWREGGLEALRSAGPMSVERLSPAQWERLVRELAGGPLAHGWDEGQGWTPGAGEDCDRAVVPGRLRGAGGVAVAAAARLVGAGPGASGVGA
ncbi:hypothetical protein GCM10009634_68150 [Saccharothrix xinjiangensis]